MSPTDAREREIRTHKTKGYVLLLFDENFEIRTKRKSFLKAGSSQSVLGPRQNHPALNRRPRSTFTLFQNRRGRPERGTCENKIGTDTPIVHKNVFRSLQQCVGKWIRSFCGELTPLISLSLFFFSFRTDGPSAVGLGAPPSISPGTNSRT